MSMLFAIYCLGNEAVQSIFRSYHLKRLRDLGDIFSEKIWPPWFKELDFLIMVTSAA